MASSPGFSAVPGFMQPGAIWPGGLGSLSSAAPAIVFALGTARFQWATQEPYLS